MLAALGEHAFACIDEDDRHVGGPAQRLSDLPLMSEGERRQVLGEWSPGPAAEPVRQTVLELCDGRRTLREVEEGVLRTHPDLFPGLAEASAFAAEVVTRYAE